MQKIAMDYTKTTSTYDAEIAREIRLLEKATRLTDQQQAVLDFYLEDTSVLKKGKSILVEAAKLAGYQGSLKALEAISKSIILWFERNTASSDIFRIMDLGETTVVKKLKNIIETSSNTNTILSAIKIVASAISLTGADLEEIQGSSIHITTAEQDKECFKVKHDEHMLKTPKQAVIAIVR